jgi:hypothetical protein
LRDVVAAFASERVSLRTSLPARLIFVMGSMRSNRWATEYGAPRA